MCKWPSATRRQFLLAGGALTARAFLREPRILFGAADAGADEYVLRVDYSEREIGAFRLRMRTYNSRIPGPLIVTRPGHTLQIKLINNLPPDPPATAPPGVDPLNNPHAFNTTNLHMHGMQVIPHLFQPIGTLNPAAPMIGITSKQSRDYTFTLPADHPSGLYWYHPHFHGSADVQVVNGMAGLVLVKGPIDDVPEIAAARDELLAIQNLKLNPLNSSGTIWGQEPLAYRPSNQGGYSPTSKVELITANGAPIMTIDRRSGRPVANLESPPAYKMQPGEVLRLRILNGTDGIFLRLMLTGLEVYVIGRDGINLLKPEKAGCLSTVDQHGPGQSQRASDSRSIASRQGPSKVASNDGVVAESDERGHGRNDVGARNRHRYVRSFRPAEAHGDTSSFTRTYARVSLDNRRRNHSSPHCNVYDDDRQQTNHRRV